MIGAPEPEGYPIDIGAEWIHNLPHSLNRLKGKKGDQLDEVLIPYHLESAYSWNGKEYEKGKGYKQYKRQYRWWIRA